MSSKKSKSGYRLILEQTTPTRGDRVLQQALGVSSSPKQIKTRSPQKKEELFFDIVTGKLTSVKHKTPTDKKPQHNLAKRNLFDSPRTPTTPSPTKSSPIVISDTPTKKEDDVWISKTKNTQKTNNSKLSLLHQPLSKEQATPTSSPQKTVTSPQKSRVSPPKQKTSSSTTSTPVSINLTHSDSLVPIPIHSPGEVSDEDTEKVDDVLLLKESPKESKELKENEVKVKKKDEISKEIQTPKSESTPKAIASKIDMKKDLEVIKTKKKDEISKETQTPKSSESTSKLNVPKIDVKKDLDVVVDVMEISAPRKRFNTKRKVKSPDEKWQELYSSVTETENKKRKVEVVDDENSPRDSKKMKVKLNDDYNKREKASDDVKLSDDEKKKIPKVNNSQDDKSKNLKLKSDSEKKQNNSPDDKDEKLSKKLKSESEKKQNNSQEKGDREMKQKKKDDEDKMPHTMALFSEDLFGTDRPLSTSDDKLNIYEFKSEIPEPPKNFKTYSKKRNTNKRIRFSDSSLDDELDYIPLEVEDKVQNQEPIYIESQDSLTLLSESNESNHEVVEKKKKISNTAKTVLVYPPDEPHKAVTITDKDLEVLQPFEFLNDTIIEFYLKYIRKNILKDDPKFYFFNSFFYAKLSKANGYDKVQKWTRNIDLFSTNYIFVPINESAHWSLCIICLDTEDYPVPIKPCMILLDSLHGSNSTAFRRLRSYLEEEWKAKKMDKDGAVQPRKFTREDIPDYSPKVPGQNNYCDCGLFLLHYAEVFCRATPNSIDELNQDWFKEEDITDKRNEILNLINELSRNSTIASIDNK